MRKILILLYCIISLQCYCQSSVEYISTKCDSMALINKHDIDIINNVFEQRNTLKELNNINDKVICNLEVKNKLLDSIITKQRLTIQNDGLIQANLEKNYLELKERYAKDIKKEQSKKISFQALTGIGVIVIILLLL